MGGVIPRPFVSILLLLVARVKDANPITIIIANAMAQHLFPISAAALKEFSNKETQSDLWYLYASIYNVMKGSSKTVRVT